MAVSPYFNLTPDEAANLLDGLVSVGLAQISRANVPKGQYPVIEGIQAGRIRYRRRDPKEHWQSWREMTQPMFGGEIAYGDCEDLSAAVAAELGYNGIPARTYVYKYLYVALAKVCTTDTTGRAKMSGNFPLMSLPVIYYCHCLAPRFC